MKSNENDGEPVKVFLRLRPEQLTSNTNSNHQQQSNDRYNISLPLDNNSLIQKDCIYQIDDKTIKLIQITNNLSINELQSPRKQGSKPSQPIEKTYTFDQIFSQQCNQEDIYYQISPLVKATVRGYNTTVFAYGCTGSGKIYIYILLLYVLNRIDNYMKFPLRYNARPS